MAYSDYGGYAFRNGIRIVGRSDACLTTEGVKSTPGMWPGFVIPEGRDGGSYHALLGDGPIHIGLYKQSSLSIFRAGERVDIIAQLPDEAIYTCSDGDRLLDSDYYKTRNFPCDLVVDGWKITARFVEEENHYLFVKVEQPNGTLWHGWSGYGVGAGLEDGDHGYSTETQNDRLCEFWPEAIKEDV